ncbi:MAG TPA: T9SS type A sorting domain-containing protein [Rhodothermales bacterium]
MLIPRTAIGQFAQCPFPPEAAVPDTLDPIGYYPLELGNAWEYVRWSGCCLDRVSRREVVGDTLIDGTSYRVVKESSVYYAGNYGDPLDTSTIARREVQRDYVRLHEGSLHAWSPQSGVDMVRDLSRPFQSCHVDEETGVQTVVWALTEAPYTLQKNDGSVDGAPPVGKGMDVDGEQFLYQHGVGYVSGGHADTLEVLTYATIGDRSFGEPLEEVFGALVSRELEGIPPGDFALVNYPNPFADATHLSFTLPDEGMVTMHVTDLLGRRVAVPLDRVRLAAGAHDLEWRPAQLASGVYFVQLIHNDRIVVTRSIILAH